MPVTKAQLKSLERAVPDSIKGRCIATALGIVRSSQSYSNGLPGSWGW